MNATQTDTGFRVSERARSAAAYSTARSAENIDVWLDANEGAPASPRVLEALRSADAETLRRYPDAAPLEGAIGAMLGVDAARVLMTNGSDEAIDRVCRASLQEGRTLVTHDPTFSMIGASARLAGAETVGVEWVDGKFPAESLCEAIDTRTGLVALVTPNNPTGGVIGLPDIMRVCERAANVGALVMVDLAYVEFADEDPTSALLSMPNVVVTRTLSKAFGLAGLRVGYALSSEPIVRTLRAVGGPYPVSSVSIRAGLAAIEDRASRSAYIDGVRREREAFGALAEELGVRALPSRANSVALRSTRAPLVRDGLASLGIAVRGWDTNGVLGELVRVTMPGEQAAFDRLCKSLRSVLAPEALLLDMDGVLADVRDSYRHAIVGTSKAFGVSVTNDDIDRVKALGDANNDWLVTQHLINAGGVDVGIDAVRERFQRLYLGDDIAPGLRETETVIPSRDLLERLATRTRLGVVTGRPRDEAEWFLERFGIADLFGCVVAMEDAPAKPDGAPTRLAMQRLGAASAWLVGDTVDDVRSARAAGVMPVGIAAPGGAGAPSGSGLVIDTLDDLLEALS